MLPIAGEPTREQLVAALAEARRTNTDLHRRVQAAEAAMADLRRCSEKLESGSAWCSGSLGRAFLAYDNHRLRVAVEDFIHYVTADPDGAIDWKNVGAWLLNFGRQAEKWRDAATPA